MTADPFACCEIECEYLEGRTLQECEKTRCCWTYVRRREEDRKKQREADRNMREKSFLSRRIADEGATLPLPPVGRR